VSPFLSPVAASKLQHHQIRIPDATKGFRAGQHIRLRVFFDGRGVFESHPFSIMGAPAGLSCLQAGDVDQYYLPICTDDTKCGEQERTEDTPGILLGVRVKGNWTKALNEYALPIADDVQSSDSLDGASSSADSPVPRALAPVSVRVMFDGPYGGCALDLPDYERVLLVAGGSGATFAVGVLDELVAACCLSERKQDTRTQRVEFVWCIRSFGGFSLLCFVFRAA
jgi:ferric-chelate reductase